jgi:D-proline reductase (dithiol) PrdB
MLLRLKNRVIAKVITRFPSLSKQFTDAYSPLESKDIPWTPFNKELNTCKVGLVTTAGVHHKAQKPFNMADKNGDPSYRSIDSRKPLNDLIITHDYYDHTDADRDINIVFPIERLKEFEAEGIIGEVAEFNYGFMGHIDGHHIQTLINETGPEVAARLKEQAVHVVLLTPG